MEDRFVVAKWEGEDEGRFGSVDADYFIWKG